MEEGASELLKTSYGEVAYETFRNQGMAFVDKSLLLTLHTTKVVGFLLQPLLRS